MNPGHWEALVSPISLEHGDVYKLIEPPAPRFCSVRPILFKIYMGLAIMHSYGCRWAYTVILQIWVVDILLIAVDINPPNWFDLTTQLALRLPPLSLPAWSLTLKPIQSFSLGNWISAMVHVQVGDKVRAKDQPSRGWQGVNGSAVGTIKTMEEDRVVVDFPTCQSWEGVVADLEHHRLPGKDDKVQVSTNCCWLVAALVGRFHYQHSIFTLFIWNSRCPT